MSYQLNYQVCQYFTFSGTYQRTTNMDSIPSSAVFHEGLNQIKSNSAGRKRIEKATSILFLL